MKINIGLKPGQKAYMFDPNGCESDYSIYKIKEVTIERIVGQIRVVAIGESGPEIDLNHYLFAFKNIRTEPSRSTISTKQSKV